jgi:hypothetical protein
MCPLLHRYSPTLVAVAIGAAQHAIDAFIEMAGTKVGGGDFSAVRDRASPASISLAQWASWVLHAPIATQPRGGSTTSPTADGP